MFKHRNPVIVLLLMLFTFGLYGFHWFYATNKSFKNALHDHSHPFLRTLALFIPLVNIIAFWKHAHSAADATDGTDPLIIFLLYLVFLPIAVYLIQTDINTAMHPGDTSHTVQRASSRVKTGR